MTTSDPRRVAVITGASRGLGRVLARTLAGEGFDLHLVARRPGPLTESAEELRRFGGETRYVSGDVVDPSIQNAVANAVAEGGRLDLLVNNASELGPSPLPKLLEQPPGSLERIWAVNFLAPLAWIRTLAPELARSRGLVVNISSDAALGAYEGWGGYGASKAALDLASRTLAKELAPAGISVVSVDPGDLRTGMHQAAFPGQDISDRPLPEVTVPFWRWLLGQAPMAVSGQRFQAQADRWTVAA